MSTGKIDFYDEKKKLGFIREDNTNKIYPFRVKRPQSTLLSTTKNELYVGGGFTYYNI